MIDCASTGDASLLALLGKHPKVERVEDDGMPGLRFQLGGWRRRVDVGRPDVDPHGLLELIDNNPVVCADAISVPCPASTLALIALGPLAASGLLVEAPLFQASASVEPGLVEAFLAGAGWTGGLEIVEEEVDLGGAVAALVLAVVPTPERLEEIDELYEERFGRSFYVQRDESSDWHVSLVLGRPYALYRLRITPDEPHSLLRIQVMADRNGKCGAAQIVHAMNVMCGFEETLGVAGEV
jgi:hypothetical protein